jgi:hypothetical protein
VIVLRERAAGMYQASAYFLAKNVAELPQEIIPAIIFGTSAYFLAGLTRDGGKFVVFLVYTVLSAISAMSLGKAISAFARTATLSAAIIAFWVEIFRLLGGYYVTPNYIFHDYIYIVWVDVLSFVKYAYLAVLQNEYHGLVIICPEGMKCPFETGEQVLAYYESDLIPIYACALILIGWTLSMRILAYIGIRFVKW